MKALTLLDEIKENIKDYPIENLKKKINNPNYPDNIYKRLAIYNSNNYDEIFTIKLDENTTISEKRVKLMKTDLDNYLNQYNPGDEIDNKFTKYISLYLVFIAKKPLHPFGNPQDYRVYQLDETFYCKDRVKYLKDNDSLCRFCVCKNAAYPYF